MRQVLQYRIVVAVPLGYVVEREGVGHAGKTIRSEKAAQEPRGI
jgi:hypothetical protein